MFNPQLTQMFKERNQRLAKIASKDSARPMTHEAFNDHFIASYDNAITDGEMKGRFYEDPIKSYLDNGGTASLISENNRNNQKLPY